MRSRSRFRAQVRAEVRRRGLEFRLDRLWGRQPAPELVGLWVLEVLACAALMFLLLANRGDASVVVRIDKAAAVAMAFGITSIAVGLYSSDTYLETRLLLINTAVGAVLAFPAVWLVGYLLGIDLIGLSESGGSRALQVLLVWTLLLFGLRMAFSWGLRANLFVRRLMIVGPPAAAARLSEAIRAVRRGFFDVVDVVPAEEADLVVGARKIRSERVWGLVLVDNAIDCIPARLMLQAQRQGLRLYSDAEFWERQLRRVDVAVREAEAVGADQPVAAPAPAPDGIEAALHRLFDIVLSLAMLVFTLPLMLLTAVAIRLDSRGPVLYRQERVGQHGRCFTLLKFRSMRPDAEASGPVWASQRDARVTRVGAFIRLTRIDELPQLINILRGEMSFIGPRPERPHFVEQLERVLPSYSERSRVKPGLTGWAQVNYPYGASVEDARAKLSYDLYYVRNRSLLLDLLILLATVRVVLFQRGAR